MGHCRPRIQRRSRSARPDGQSAVSPIIGSVLILAITILGIAGVLYWGAPMIERIQVQNAQTAMVGEFEDLRDSSRELSVPDHSRFPTVVIPRGQVSLQAGSRVMVTADQDSTHTGCDFHALNWADTSAKTQFDLSYSGCLTPKVVAGTCASDATTACLEVFKVSGATLSKQVVTACNPCATAVTVAGVDFSTGDWMIRITDGSTTLPTPTYAQAWIVSGDDVSWSTDSSTGKRAVTFDTGAIFSNSQGTNFLERPPVIGDSAFGTGYYGLWIRSLSAQSYESISGAGSHQVYLSLIGNYDRVDATVYRLRYDVSGSLAQSWCNSLLLRNAQLSGVSYQDADGDTTRTCAVLPAPSTDGARGVCYSRVAANACSTVGSTFTFRFLHARIYTSLAV